MSIIRLILKSFPHILFEVSLYPRARTRVNQQINKFIFLLFFIYFYSSAILAVFDCHFVKINCHFVTDTCVENYFPILNFAEFSTLIRSLRPALCHPSALDGEETEKLPFSKSKAKALG